MFGSAGPLRWSTCETLVGMKKKPKRVFLKKTSGLKKEKKEASECAFCILVFEIYIIVVSTAAWWTHVKVCR